VSFENKYLNWEVDFIKINITEEEMNQKLAQAFAALLAIDEVLKKDQIPADQAQVLAEAA
jgi:hypothetical protein